MNIWEYLYLMVIEGGNDGQASNLEGPDRPKKIKTLSDLALIYGETLAHSLLQGSCAHTTGI